MPRIIEYQTVLELMTGEGFRCNYPNGGSFGFSAEAGAQVRGWIGLPDGSIQPGMRSVVRMVSPPFESNLARLAGQLWRDYLPGFVWVMPASHWSFELNHGNGDWMPSALEGLGLDWRALGQRTDAAAIEFLPSEDAVFCQFLQRMLEKLSGSDVVLAFPGRGTVCTVHHHKQLWWTTTDAGVLAALDELAANNASL